MPSRRLLINLSLASLTLIVSLKVGDMVVGRVLGFDFKTGPGRYLVLREAAPNYARLARPDRDTLAMSEGLSDDLVPYRVDADGFLKGPVEASGPVDVAFVGGSTTECAYVPEALRFPHLVSTLLLKTSGQSVRTLNAGYSGNNTMHGLLLTIGKILPYKPRLVVFMEAVNDLAVLEKTGSYWEAPESRALVRVQRGRPLAITFKDWLVPNTWQVAKTYVGGWTLALPPDEFTGYRADRPAANFEESEAQFHAALVTFVQTVRAWGSQPVLMTQFNRMEVEDHFVSAHSGRNPDDFATLVNRYKRFNDTVRRVAAEQGVVLVDLDREIPHSSRYIIDAVHVNPEGSRLVSDVIAKHLAEAFSDFTIRPRP